MQHLPVQLGLHFQHEPLPRLPAASRRRKPHTAKEVYRKKQLKTGSKEQKLTDKYRIFIISVFVQH